MFVSSLVCGINAERQSVEALLAFLTTDRRISSAMAVPKIDDEKELLKKERACLRSALWRKANPKRNRTNITRWAKANPEKQKASIARWVKNNYEQYTAKAAIWREANPEKVKAMRKKARLKILSTPEGKLNKTLKKHMSRCLSKTKETASQLKYSLPYTMKELRVHLERQFLTGMSWDNRSDWHIDHIIPLSSFKFTSSSDPEFQAAWALSNLRPLWAKENQVKSKKRLTLL